MKKQKFTREELYELIWSKPLVYVTGSFETSSVLLQNLCFHYDIPVPASGHWSRELAAERRKTPLSPQKENYIIDIPEALNAAQADLLYLGESLESFHVPKNLINPDPIISAAKNSVYVDRYWNGAKEMFRTDFENISIRASKLNMDRALRIMDTLIKAWKKRGYSIGLERGLLVIKLRKERYYVSIREITKKMPEKDKRGDTIYESTGKLVIELDSYPSRVWKDGKLQLEDFVLDILNYTEFRVRERERNRTANEARQKREEDERQRKISQIRANDDERKAFDILLEESLKWHRFRIVDEYLQELYRSAPHSEEFLKWYRWAKTRQQIFDPLRERIESFPK